MTEDYSEYIYSAEDIDKAFEFGYVTEVDELESLMDHINDMQKRLLQTMKDMIHQEEKVSPVGEDQNQDKVVSFQSYREK